MTSTPAALTDIYSRWTKLGEHPQPKFTWRPTAWASTFSKSHLDPRTGVDLIAALEAVAEAAGSTPGDRKSFIGRDAVRLLHTPKALGRLSTAPDPQAVVTAFVAAMIWGFGANGLGPFRTERILTKNPDAIDQLVEIARIAQDPAEDGGGLGAFAKIAEQRAKKVPYVKYLGPAFGTKFLYFLTAATDEVETTPVMDAVVRRWFRDEAHETLYTTWWDRESYEKYIDRLDVWREQLPAATGSASITREDVELLIFADGRGDSDSWLKGDEFVRPEELGLDQLLDALQSEVDQLAAKPRADSTEGPDLLKQLRAWIAEDDSVDI